MFSEDECKTKRSTPAVRQSFRWTGVFQHHAEDVEETRRHIAENVYRCLASGHRVIKPDPPLCLYYGYYSLGGKKDVDRTLGDLIWKHSELTGKYVGCKYWSVEAKRLFEKEMLTGIGEPTLDDAWKMQEVLKMKARGEMRLEHEHVFPRKCLRAKLLRERGAHLSLPNIEKVMNEFAMGCVVLKKEHPPHKECNADCDNPWRRYKGIMLADNKGWDSFQRELIERAGLLN